MKNIFCRLEKAKQLKEVGFTQNTEFYWINVYENLEGDEECWQIHHVSFFLREKKIYHPISAPLVEEIINTFKHVEIEKVKKGFQVSNGEDKYLSDNVIEALCDLYIWENTTEIKQ